MKELAKGPILWKQSVETGAHIRKDVGRRWCESVARLCCVGLNWAVGAALRSTTWDSCAPDIHPSALFYLMFRQYFTCFSFPFPWNGNLPRSSWWPIKAYHNNTPILLYWSFKELYLSNPISPDSRWVSCSRVCNNTLKQNYAGILFKTNYNTFIFKVDFLFFFFFC